jgi:deazaflavin-dependent oxidoreductase (nitroreductase family)
MEEYIPSKAKWVRDQVELYEGSNGAEGATLKESGLSVIIVTHRGRKTGAIRKTPLMRAVDGPSYILVASQGGAPNNPSWYYNLVTGPAVEIRDKSDVYSMKVREVSDATEKKRLWDIAVEAYPPYAEYQERTSRQIPVFLAELDLGARLRRPVLYPAELRGLWSNSSSNTGF